MPEERCVHDFLPGQCALCQKQELGDEKPDVFFFGGLVKK